MTSKKYWIIGEVCISFISINILTYILSGPIGHVFHLSTLTIFVIFFGCLQVIPIIYSWFEIRKAEEEFANPVNIKTENLIRNEKYPTWKQKFRRIIKTDFEVWVFFSVISQAYFFITGWITAQNEPFFQKEKPHVGIIVIEYHKYFGKEYFYGLGIDLLIKHFRGKTPYTIYPCATRECVVGVIKNKNVKSVWIFGHGDHGGIRYNISDRILDYKELVDTFPKNFKKESVYQMHCNHENYPSLVHLLSEDRGFANNTTNTLFKTRTFVRKILTEQ